MDEKPGLLKSYHPFINYRIRSSSTDLLAMVAFSCILNQREYHCQGGKQDIFIPLT